VVVIQNIFPVIRHEKIFVSIVIVISNAYALSPAGMRKTGFFRHVRKSSIVIVTVQVICWLFLAGNGIESGSVHYENIRPAIIVIIENGYAGSGGFKDEFLCIDAAECVWSIQAGTFRLVHKICHLLLACFGVL